MTETSDSSGGWNSKARWGRALWDVGHVISFAYPESSPTPEQREHMARFYESLTSVVPCDECKTDYAALLAENPVRKHLNSRDSLSKWFYEIHNQVNRKLGKPTTLTYDQVKQRYLSCSAHEEKAQSCQKSLSGHKLLVLGLGILLVILVVYLVVQRKK